MNAQHVRAIARKEIWHLLRDPRSLALILLMPSMLLFLFGYAIRLDLYEAPIAIVQESRDAATEALAAQFDASRAFNIVLRANDRREATAALQQGRVWAALMVPPDYARRLERGDAYKMLSGGGGGFGNPLERDIEKVAEDVREGYVSAEVAREVYRVALDSKGEVHAEATQRLRSAPRAARNGTADDLAWAGQ